jgi:hypothetical protein
VPDFIGIPSSVKAKKRFTGIAIGCIIVSQ